MGTLQRYSLDSSSAVSSGRGDSRIPSIGSVIADLSIRSGSGIAGRLAALREQDPADAADADGADERHSGGATGTADVSAIASDAADVGSIAAHTADVGSSDAGTGTQAAPETATFIQERLARLDLESSSEAAAAEPSQQDPLQQPARSVQEAAPASSTDAAPQPADAGEQDPTQPPEGKRLRQAAFSVGDGGEQSAEQPSSPAALPAPRKQLRLRPPGQLPSHRAAEPLAAAGAATEPSAAAASGSPADEAAPPADLQAASQASLHADVDSAARGSPGSSPGKYFQSGQPRFTLGSPGDAVLSGRRRQLPPAAQVHAALHAQRMIRCSLHV